MNKKLSNQATNQPTNLSSNQVNKIDSVTQRMNQQPHQLSDATMRAAPSFEFSPGLPSDWSTFRVSRLKSYYFLVFPTIYYYLLLTTTFYYFLQLTTTYYYLLLTTTYYY